MKECEMAMRMFVAAIGLWGLANLCGAMGS
jgi:hypothetical protein